MGGGGDGEKNGGTWQRLEGNEEGDMIKKMEELLRTDNTEGLGKDRQLDILSLLEERASLTHSYIGPGSQAGSKTRLVNCIVMNEVVIEEGCQLTNCILCDNSRICANTTLINCLVGTRFIITSQSNHQNEVLTIAMELE